MSSVKCAQCGLVNWQTAAECKRCKSPIASQAEAPQYHQPVYPYAPPPPPVDFSQPQDYPHAQAEQHYGMWQDGSLLVMDKHAQLPPACIKCNEPVAQSDFKRKLSWHPPVLYCLIFAGWLVYVIVALVVSKRATVHFGLCELHKTKRRYMLAICWLLVLIAAMGIVGAIQTGTAEPAMVGALFVLGALIFYAVAVPVVRVKKMDDNYIWLEKINKRYVEQFPFVPGK